MIRFFALVILGIVVFPCQSGFAESKAPWKAFVSGIVVPGGSYYYIRDTKTGRALTLWVTGLAGSGIALISLSDNFREDKSYRNANRETLSEAMESGGSALVIIAGILHLAGAWHGATLARSSNFQLSTNAKGHVLLSYRF